MDEEFIDQQIEDLANNAQARLESGDNFGAIEISGQGMDFLQEHGDSNKPQHVEYLKSLMFSQLFGQYNSGDWTNFANALGASLDFFQDYGDSDKSTFVAASAQMIVAQAIGQGISENEEGRIQLAGQGLAFLDKHGDTNTPLYVETQARLFCLQAKGQGNSGNYEGQVQAAAQGLKVIQEHGVTNNPQHVKIWARLFNLQALGYQNLGDWASAAKVVRQSLDFLENHGDMNNPEHVGTRARFFCEQAIGQGISGAEEARIHSAAQGLTVLEKHGDIKNPEHVETWAHLITCKAAGLEQSGNLSRALEATGQGLAFLQEHGDVNNREHVSIWAELFDVQATIHSNNHNPARACVALTHALNLLSKWLFNPTLYVQQWELRFRFMNDIPQLMADGLVQLWDSIGDFVFADSLAHALPFIYQALLEQEVERNDWRFIQNVRRIIETLSLHTLFQRTKVVSPLFALWQASRKENKPSPGQCLPFIEGLLAALSLAHNAADANDSETHQIVVQTLYNELLVTLDSDLRQQLELPNIEGMLTWFQRSLKHLAQDSMLIDLAELLVALFLTDEFLEQPFAPAGQFIFNSLLSALVSFPAEYARLNELKTRTPKRLGGLAQDDPVSQETAKRHARFFGLLRSGLLVSAEEKFEEHMDRGQNRDQILLEYLETAFELISESNNAMPNYLALLPELFRDRAWVEDIAGSGRDSEELEATELYNQLYLEDAKSLQHLLEALPEIQGIYVSMVIKDSQALFVASAGPKKTRVWTVKEPDLEHKITAYVNQILGGINRLWENSVPLIERLQGESTEAAKSKFLASALNSPSKTNWFSKILQVLGFGSGTITGADPDETSAKLFKMLELHHLVDLAKESGAKTLLWSPFGPLHAIPPGLFSCSSEGSFFEIFDRIVVVPGAAKRAGKVALVRTQEPVLLTQPLSKDQTQDETFFRKIRQGLGVALPEETSALGSLTPENVRENQRAAFQVWIAHGQPSRRIHRGSRWEKTFCLGVGTDDGVIEFKEFVRELEGEENLLPPIMSFLCFQGLLAQNALTVEGFARRLLPFTEALIASPFPIQRSLLRMILESEAPEAPSLKPDLTNLGSLPVSLARRLPELALKWPALNGVGEELASFLERKSLRAFLTSYCTVWDILKRIDHRGL